MLQIKLSTMRMQKQCINKKKALIFVNKNEYSFNTYVVLIFLGLSSFRMGFSTRHWRNIGGKTKEELNKKLRLFYATARNKDGGNYSTSTLLGFRNDIRRFLNNPPFKKSMHIATDPALQQSNQMLDAKLKNMKQQGEESVKHKPCIENEDLRRLKESAVMSPSTPQGLPNNVWFHITLFVCRRGREGQRNLKKSSFVFLQDENGKRYATMAHDEASKNHQGLWATTP